MIQSETLQPLLESLLEAVLIVDGLELRVQLANTAASQLLGICHGELVGRHVIELAVTPEDIFFWEDVAAGLSNEILSETSLRRADGSSVKVDRHVSRVVLEQGNVFYVVAISDQSKQQRVEDELEKLVAELRATLESTADGILVVNLHNGIRSYNHRFSELWDLPVELMTRKDDDALHAWLASQVLEADSYGTRLLELSHAPLMETTDVLVLRSGRVLERRSLPQYARGRPIGRVFSFRDITQDLANESRLRLAAKVFSSSLDSILVSDGDYRIVTANPQSTKLSGYTEEDFVGQLADAFFFKPNAPGFMEQVRMHLAHAGYWEGELWHRRKDGSALPGLTSFVRVLDEGGGPPQFIIFFKDLTETLAANKRIEELAYYDILTGLPNRALLKERLEFALSWSRREGKTFAILFLDLDRFKHINDSLGHVFGDRILVQVAQRISACLRQTDTAARLGGDEFLILVHDVDAHGAEFAATRINAALSEIVLLDGMSFTVTGSIGVALFPADGETADDLMKNADAAMYRAKERGRAGFRFYQPQMNVDLLSRMKLDHAMREGLLRGDFRLHYQPRVNMTTGKIAGAEALLRWFSPEQGMIPPAHFIPVAEETGFIAALGDWVLHEAVEQALRWRQAGFHIPVAVNVSAIQFQDAGFVGTVATILGESGLPPEALELELTESILIQDAEEALQRLTELDRLGIKLSIDDFGTGYSSLMYLKRFPIETLKIDRSFVNGLPDDESDAAIVIAIINLGRALHLKIVAEGVETEGQRLFLKDMGCDTYQGFLMAPGLEPDALLALVKLHGSSDCRIG